MLNTRTLNLPYLSPMSILKPSSLPLPSRQLKSTPRQSELVGQNTKWISSPSSVTSAVEGKGKNDKIVVCNNMFEEVQWFNKQYRYQQFSKMIVLTLFIILLFSTRIIGYQLFLSFLSISTLGFARTMSIIMHNKTKKIWIYTVISISIFVMLHHLFINVLYFISPNICQVLYQRYLTLGCCIVLGAVYAMHCVLQVPPPISNALDLFSCSSGFVYLRCLKSSLYCAYLQKYSLFVGYILVSCMVYIPITLIKLNLMQQDRYSEEYWYLIHPLVICSQAIVFALALLIRETVRVVIEVGVFWKMLPKLYQKRNQYTDMPLIMQLLSVVGSQEIRKHVSNTYLQLLFPLLSLSESRRNNNLTLAQQHNIYKHSLCYILALMNLDNDILGKKFQIWARGSRGRGVSGITQLKKQVSYFQIVTNFGDEQIDKFINEMSEVLLKVEKVSMENGDVYLKGIIKDMDGWTWFIDYGIMMGKLFLNGLTVRLEYIRLWPYLTTFQLLLTILTKYQPSTANIPFLEELLSKIAKLKHLANHAYEIQSEFGNLMIAERMKSIVSKCQKVSYLFRK